jgi:NIMA (never in mitosis gene a)-related kinase
MQKDPQKHYLLQDLIGKGTYASVYRAVSTETKRIVAIKIVNILRVSDADLSAALNEIRILSSINNPYIVQYHESFIDRTQSQLWVVMELMEGGDLAQLIEQNEKLNKNPSEKLVWTFFIQALLALKALHSLNIIHRDLKPGNVYLSADKKSIRLGDMNVSKVVDFQFAKSLIGSPAYLAPEVWKMQPYTNNCDIFSLGCSIYEFATFQLPFNGDNMVELKNGILNQKPIKLPSKYSSELQTIITKCLTKIPDVRPTAKQMLEDPIVKEKMHMLKIDISSINFADNKLGDKINVPKNLLSLNSKLPKREFSPDTSQVDQSKNIEALYFQTMQEKSKKGKAPEFIPKKPLQSSKTLTAKNELQALAASSKNLKTTKKSDPVKPSIMKSTSKQENMDLINKNSLPIVKETSVDTKSKKFSVPDNQSKVKGFQIKTSKINPGDESTKNDIQSPSILKSDNKIRKISAPQSSNMIMTNDMKSSKAK